MNDAIQPFDFHGAQVRALTDENGEPWFVAKDVCDILGLTNVSVALSGLDEDETAKIDPKQYLGSENRSNQPINIVSEPGLYVLIGKSRKPEAKAFRRWVNHEVLPSIRRHGVYATDDVIDKVLGNPDFGIRLLSELKNERARRRDAERTIEAQRPKVLFADAVASGGRDILVGELAKILRQNGVDTGQNRLFDRLRREGYLMRRNGVPNMPTQRSADLGLFRVVENAVTHSDGHVTATYTTKVTPKGQQYFVNRYLVAGASE